jgi:hypothetical protein
MVKTRHTVRLGTFGGECGEEEENMGEGWGGKAEARGGYHSVFIEK